MFKHFLITRFNLRMSNWHATKSNQAILDEDWHLERFDLFEKYCLPSVINQSNKNFTWVIFFDNSTPPRFKTKADELMNQYAAFLPVFIDGGDALTSSLKSIIKEALKGDDNFVITSRLDNDDSLHRDFIKTIQEKATDTQKCIVDPQQGYRMNMNGEVIKVKKKFGPFISLIEPTLNFETVISKAHGDWKHFPKNGVKIIEQPLWLQTIHSKNMVNAFPLFSRKVKNLNLHDFGFEKP